MAHDSPSAGRIPLDPTLVSRLSAHVVSGGDTTTINAPFTGTPLATLPISSPDDVARAFAAARAAQSAWADTDPRTRACPFLRFHDLLLDRQHTVLDILQAETGKARWHAFLEVLGAAAGPLYHARTAPKLLAPHRRAGAFPLVTRAVELHQPKGVVAVITPWNYPLELAMADVAPALLAGNAVVHKPDTQTALTTLWARDLLVEAGLPGELWQVVLGAGPDIGPTLVEHADHVAFTGSTRTGRQIARQAAERLIGCSLELGGKNPMIVLPDADLDRAAAGVLDACFTNAGQLCISAERLYVPAASYDAFLERLLPRVAAMRLAADFDFTADMGSLTLPRQLETVTRHVGQAVDKGARVLAGGRPRPDVGPLFYEPTVLAGVEPGMEVCGEETFGPVVSVYRYGDLDEAVAYANDIPYGLTASVWGRDVAAARRLAARLRVGGVSVNDGYAAAYGSYGAPMGGMKDSGLGRRHGADGLLRYTEAQTVASQHLMGFAPPRGVSPHRWAATLTTGLRLLKRTRVR